MRRYFSTRDASWYNCPDVHSVKQFHAYGTGRRSAQAACSGRNGMFLDESNDSLAEELKPDRVCHRPACWKVYQEELAKVKGVER